jgi:hypothetical protein
VYIYPLKAHISKGKSNMKNNLLRTLKTTPNKELVYICEDDKAVLHIKYYVSPQERRNLIQQVKEAGLALFEYYLSLSSKGKQLISDDVTAEHFGWDVAKAKRLRQNLTKAGWFRSESFTYSGGRKGITYYLGKAAVRAGANIKPYAEWLEHQGRGLDKPADQSREVNNA